MNLHLPSLPLSTRERRSDNVMTRLASLLVAAAPAATLALPSVALAQASPANPSPGLTYKSLRDGTGASPTATYSVRVHSRCTLMNRTEFDSSYKRGEPASFPLDRVIKCWTEGVQRMKVGGKAKLTCPAAIAYGERGTPGGPIPPNATLTFEVELLGISGK